MSQPTSQPLVGGEAQSPDVLAPMAMFKTEIDSSTYIRSKQGLRMLANFTFEIRAHSLIPDRDGNVIYVLYCGTQEGKVFKVPVTYKDTDNLEKICSKVNQFKSGYNACLSKEESKMARLHTMVRAQIDEYKSKNQVDQKEVIVADEVGFKNISGLGDVYIVGPKQVMHLSLWTSH